MSAKSARTPLSNAELAKLTAEEFVRLKLTDDEKHRLREINRERARQREKRTARLLAEGQPIVADLRAIGRNVTSVWDMLKIPNRHADAIPVLLKHLRLPYSDRTREGIARALAIPDAKDAWPILVEEYRKAPMGVENGFRLGAKSGFAVALSATVTANTIDELIALAKDRSHGSSRLLLLRGLRRSRAPAAKKALEELASDPELSKEIASWRRARRTPTT
ncbi:hypothetical protein [Reyranella sp.]|uniref:hypothetical protein n=1 Tax=Reyranella sp. TaxID=1929291 RepID=UPI003784C9B7